MNELWTNLCQAAGIQMDESLDRRLNAYIELLLRANERMNLTRIQTREEAEVRHVGDALTLLPLIASGRQRLADVGSGGGVPGIPLAIARPDLRVTLIESTRKKAAFLRDAIHELSLENVEVADVRAEELAHSERRETFAVVAARALASMNVLAEWCLPLVKTGGKLLAMKGEKAAAELASSGSALKKLGGGCATVHPAHLPGIDHHVIVEVAKISSSPRIYPRSPAQVSAQPL